VVMKGEGPSAVGFVVDYRSAIKLMVIVRHASMVEMCGDVM
jgi:hypothetical protein